MGLLDKAKNSQVTGYEPEEIVSIEHHSSGNYSLLLQKIKQQKPSIDYGTQIFHMICRYFSVSKGILFFRDDNNLNYSSLCSSGYDITTNHRLRLGSVFFKEPDIHKNLSCQKPFKLDHSLPCFKDFFSTREYGMIDSMYFIPVFDNSVLLSIIIITEWNDYEPNNWIELFQNISLLISGPLKKSRMALVDNEFKYEQSALIDHEILLKERLGSVKGNLVIIKLNLSSLLKDLLENSNGLTAMNIKKEVISVFKTMSGNDVEIVELQGNQILMIQKDERIPDKELYLYQLSASLPLLYTNLTDPPDLESEIFLYNASNNPEDIIKDLL